MDMVPYIEGNKALREPQIEAYIKIREYFGENPNGEALVVLPTGTGKSGLISIAPYGVSNKRVLVITPGLVTKKSVAKTLHPMEDNFWIKYNVLFDPADMPIVEEYEPEMLDSSLEKCHFIITNVQKLQKDSNNSLLKRVPPNFFDMIIVDEAHHSVANTWVEALDYFEGAKKLHLTGTPYRGDGIEIPGELIHETRLSVAMQLKYVKWLRKQTVNHSEIFFTLPDSDKKYTKDEVLEFKDIEWIEKSVALSEECSLEVIDESIKKLEELKELSPNVPHKILAVACSIKHAEDVAKWYELRGKKAILVHSDMKREELEDNFLMIEENQCEVVVSVDMLKEGYDHKYLTILALFRPYRSKNAFAQVIGRILRAIPDDEIVDYAIDNNAIVIFHEEIGLNGMWKEFSDEVDRSKARERKEYVITDKEYTRRESMYADIEANGYYTGKLDSYLQDIDFGKLFDEARERISLNVSEKVKQWKSKGLSNEDVEILEKIHRQKLISGEKGELDSLIIEKRPELARKQIREILYKDANEAAQDVLEEKGIDPKECTLYNKFKNLIHKLKPGTTNDGIIVRYINTRVCNRYGPVKRRDPEMLLMSQKYMSEVVNELRRMI